MDTENKTAEQMGEELTRFLADARQIEALAKLSEVMRTTLLEKIEYASTTVQQASAAVSKKGRKAQTEPMEFLLQLVQATMDSIEELSGQYATKPVALVELERRLRAECDEEKQRLEGDLARQYKTSLDELENDRKRAVNAVEGLKLAMHEQREEMTTVVRTLENANKKLRADIAELISDLVECDEERERLRRSKADKSGKRQRVNTSDVPVDDDDVLLIETSKERKKRLAREEKEKEEKHRHERRRKKEEAMTPEEEANEKERIRRVEERIAEEKAQKLANEKRINANRRALTERNQAGRALVDRLEKEAAERGEAFVIPGFDVNADDADRNRMAQPISPEERKKLLRRRRERRERAGRALLEQYERDAAARGEVYIVPDEIEVRSAEEEEEEEEVEVVQPPIKPSNKKPRFDPTGL